MTGSATSNLSGRGLGGIRDVSPSARFSDAVGDPLTALGRSSDEADATVPVLADHATLTWAGRDEGSEAITFKVWNAALTGQMK